MCFRFEICYIYLFVLLYGIFVNIFSKVPAFLNIVDIAGLVAGANEGQVCILYRKKLETIKYVVTFSLKCI